MRICILYGKAAWATPRELKEKKVNNNNTFTEGGTLPRLREGYETVTSIKEKRKQPKAVNQQKKRKRFPKLDNLFTFMSNAFYSLHEN